MRIYASKAIAPFLGAFVLCAGTALARPQDDQRQGIPPDAAGGTLQRGVPASNLPSHAGHNKTSTTNLIDHGGTILPSAKVYYIWWGNSSGWPSDAQTALTDLVDGLNGSSFQSDIFPQYMRNASISTTYATSFSDPGTPPARGPSTSTILNEACKTLTANNQTPDPNAIYVVFTSNFPGHVNYCAWHSWGACNGTTIQVAYMPNTTGVSGCNDPQFTCNSYTAGTDSIANVLSHELSEAITDADGSAWYDSKGSEIGDKCAWQFQSCVNLTNGNWQLQQEWSNHITGCLQQ